MHLPLRSILGLVAALGGAVVSSASELGLHPPRVIEQPLWVYPAQVARESIYQGQARVLISVSEEGELLDFIVLGYTHPAFAQEVAIGLPLCRFAPGRVRGEPATTRVPITIHFEQQGTVVSMTSGEAMERYVSRLASRTDYRPTVCPGPKLDRPLQPAVIVSPGYPAELRHRAESGSVTVDFYVDAAGKVRMPATAAGAHPIFARMAIGAVEQWSFEPPTSGGEPVLVHVQQQFRFLPPTEPAKNPSNERTAAAVSPGSPAPQPRF